MNYMTEANEIASSIKKPADKTLKSMPSLEGVTKPILTTDEAAYYLNRKPQTLRLWACGASYNPGPIAPMRINGRLGWRTKDVKALLGL